jgi:hypothetical protein
MMMDNDGGWWRMVEDGGCFWMKVNHCRTVEDIGRQWMIADDGGG